MNVFETTTYQASLPRRACSHGKVVPVRTAVRDQWGSAWRRPEAPAHDARARYAATAGGPNLRGRWRPPAPPWRSLVAAFLR